MRPRTGADLGACARVLADVHVRDGYPVNWPADPRGWLDQPSLLGAWVAVDETAGSGAYGPQAVGHIALARSAEGDAAPGLWSRREGVGAADAAVISRLFVSTAARGHGLGARLMAAAVAEARRRGLHPVLDVVATDTGAVALYERLGWEPLGTVEQRWAGDRTVEVRCYAHAP